MGDNNEKSDTLNESIHSMDADPTLHEQLVPGEKLQEARSSAENPTLSRDTLPYHWARSEERDEFGRFARWSAYIAGSTVVIFTVGATILKYIEYKQFCNSRFHEYRLNGANADPSTYCSTGDVVNYAFYRGFLFYGALSLLAALFVMVYVVGFRLAMLRRQLRSRLIVEAAQESLRNIEKSVFPKVEKSGSALELSSLWDATHERLSIYHSIATQQAQVSFRRANTAMVVGFLIVGLSIPVAFFANGVAGSIAVSLLGAIGAGLSAFIGQTFIRSQEAAAEHLRAYFLQPLEFSRYLVAERLLNTLGEERKAEGILLIVRGIAKFPPDDIDDGKQ